MIRPEQARGTGGGDLEEKAQGGRYLRSVSYAPFFFILAQVASSALAGTLAQSALVLFVCFAFIGL